MKKDLIEKIDISLQQNTDFKEMTILTLESAKEVLQIYMNLESDYINSQKTLDNEISSFKDRTQEVKDKIDEFYNSSSITLEQVKVAEELCNTIKEQVINYSSHIDEMQDKIEADKAQMESFKTQSEDFATQSKDYRDQVISLKDEITTTKTDLEEEIKEAKEAFENNLKTLGENINDFNSKLEDLKNQISTLIQDGKTELQTLNTDSKTQISTLVQEGKEDIDKTTENSKTQIQKLLENLPKTNDKVLIEGTEATVLRDTSIIHYKFEEGSTLENVDFIDEKAPNGVGTLLGDKIENFHMADFKNAISFVSDKTLATGHMNTSFALNEGSLTLNSTMVETSTNEAGEENYTSTTSTINLNQNINLAAGENGINISTQSIDLATKNQESTSGFSITPISINFDSHNIGFSTNNDLMVFNTSPEGVITGRRVLLEGDVKVEEGLYTKGNVAFNRTDFGTQTIFFPTDLADLDVDREAEKIFTTPYQLFCSPNIDIGLRFPSSFCYFNQDIYCYLNDGSYASRDSIADFNNGIFLQYSQPYGSEVINITETKIFQTLSMGYGGIYLGAYSNIFKINTGLFINDYFIKLQAQHPSPYSDPGEVSISLEATKREISLEANTITYNGREVLLK